MQNDIGQRLGNYHLLRPLGRGGYANVYLGEHVYLKTQVAVKVLRERTETQDVDGLLKEAQTIAALKHPHILRILDFGIEGETLFLVMEYAPGGTVRQKYPLGSTIPLPIVISYVKQMAMALHYAHEQKIVHRDVKPENMLVETEQKIVLSDFGIAVPAHNTQSLRTQESAGTVLYMAPEQLRGKARPASDQYALGAVIYEWLSGTCPFGGLTPIEIAMQHVLESPPSLLERSPNISVEVEQVVLKALAKEPQQRFGTIEEFANALEQAYQPTTPLVSIQAVVPIQRVEPPPPPVGDPMSTAPVELLLTYRGHAKEVSALAWSPDGSRIVSGGRDEMAQVWDASTNKLILTYHGHFSTGDHSSTVGISTIAWSPDGAHIASAGNDETAEVWNGTVHIWEAATGKHILSYGSHFGSVRAVAWSPNSTYIASLGAWDNTVHVWEVATGRHILTYDGHASFVHQIAWSPDGTDIASGSDDKTVQIWNASTGLQIKTYADHSESVATVTWSPDGTHIASASSDGTMHVWNSSTGRRAWQHDIHSDHSWPHLSWSPNGTYIVSSGRWDNTVEIWEASTGKLALTYRGHSSFVKAIAWSPDGSRIASGDSQGIVQVWHVMA